jgi:hypothetical protein
MQKMFRVLSFAPRMTWTRFGKRGELSAQPRTRKQKIAGRLGRPPPARAPDERGPESIWMRFIVRLFPSFQETGTLLGAE